MMTKKSPYRETIYATILVCYLLPVFIFSQYTVGSLLPSKSWSIISLGLFLGLAGSVVLIIQFRKWEITLRSRLTQPIASSPIDEITLPKIALPLTPSNEIVQTPKITPLHASIDELNEYQNHIQQLQKELTQCKKDYDHVEEEIKNYQHQFRQSLQEKESSRQQQELLQQEFENFKKNTKDQFQQYEVNLSEYRKTIAEQQNSIDQQQHLILSLENKIKDLNYEIKMLLQLGDMNNSQSPLTLEERSLSHPVLDVVSTGQVIYDEMETLHQTLPDSSDKHIFSPYDAAMQLQKCIEIAVKLTGAAHLSGGLPRFKDLSIDSYALDLRRLCDALRNESSSIILLFSKKEEKILFINNPIRGLVGWSPEKFTKDFPLLVQQGMVEFKQAVEELTPSQHIQVPLIIKTKSGHDILTQCHLGIIPSGIFVNHIAGILYPAIQ